MMNPARRVGLYVRCSTSDQSVDVQIDRLHEYAQHRGFVVVETYVDHGQSGAKTSRPGLDRLVADAKRRTLDAVVVVKLDRLGRSLKHLLNLLGEFEEYGVDFVSLDDGLDTSTAVGRLFLQVRGAFAEYERALIMERVAAGVARARRQGRHLGRPPSLDRKAVDRAVRLRRFGKSIREIARLLDSSPSTVCRALRPEPLKS